MKTFDNILTMALKKKKKTKTSIDEQQAKFMDTNTIFAKDVHGHFQYLCKGTQ